MNQKISDEKLQDDYFKIIYDNSIVGTKINHPDFDMILGANVAVDEYIERVSSVNYEEAINKFNLHFSSYVTINEKILILRENFANMAENGQDPVLNLFDFMAKYCYQEYNKSENKDTRIMYQIKDYCNKYEETKEKYAKLIQTPVESIDSLDTIQKIIYYKPEYLEELVPSFRVVNARYAREVLKNNKLTIIQNPVTKTGQELLKNVKNVEECELKTDYQGTYQSGNIKYQVAANIGSGNIKKQQDAILSYTKGKYSINIVADGAGGAYNAQIASTTIVEELKKWFDKLNLKEYETAGILQINAQKLYNELSKKLYEIDKEIARNNENCFSTVVLSIITPEFVLIANVGDSTAYVVDENNNITCKTVLDSASYGLSYEEARHNPRNNQVTSMIGDNFIRTVHYQILPNNKKYRILLSSDGVTDLISWENFEKMLKNPNTNAQDFVKKAKDDPDIPIIKIDGEEYEGKSSDNIAALLIDKNEGGKRR